MVLAVRTSIKYLADHEKYKTEKPYKIRLVVSHLGYPQTNHEWVDHNVEITDVQPIRDQFCIDVNGFQFLREPSQLKNEDFNNAAKVETTYYPEMVATARKLLYRADTEIFVLSHQVKGLLPCPPARSIFS
jgi:hypothetical protein